MKYQIYLDISEMQFTFDEVKGCKKRVKCKIDWVYFQLSQNYKNTMLELDEISLVIENIRLIFLDFGLILIDDGITKMEFLYISVCIAYTRAYMCMRRYYHIP